MPAKILLGISSSYGASFLKGQVRFLIAQGYAVVIISGPGEEIRTLATQEGATLYEIPFSTAIVPWTDLIHLVRVGSILRKEKPDIINAGNPKSGFLIMMAAWLQRRRNRFFTLHGMVSDTKTGFKKWLIALTEKLSCTLAHKVIVVSPSLRDHAKSVGVLKAGAGLIIENGSCNGVDVSFFDKRRVLPVSEPLRPYAALRAGHKVIGFVGRISKDKGVDLLLRAFEKIKAADATARLLIVGPVIKNHNLDKKTLTALHNDPNIVYLGKLQDVREAYHKMTVLVLPSLREGFGNVLVEASAMELPVIASDIPGCRNAVKNFYSGELFEKNNETALAALILKIINNPELATRYGQQGRSFVMENFSNEKVWNGYLKLYRQALRTKGPDFQEDC